MKHHDSIKIAANSIYGSFGVTLSFEDAMNAIVNPDRSQSDILKEKLHNTFDQIGLGDLI